MSDEDYRFLRRVCERLVGRWRCSRRWSVDEFVSWGWWGWQCAKRLYDPARGEWRAFATAKIKNAICDQIKQRTWHPQGAQRRFRDPVHEPNEWHDALEFWTSSLSRDEREAILWYYRDGYTLSEIGRLRQCDQSTVSYALKRAREKIRAQLA